MTANSPNVELLLADADWVHGLARRLVDDVALAEDAAQETWLAALERGPRHASNLRGWLAAVTRNAVRKHRRADERRGARERVVAQAEGLPSTLDVVERFSTQHAVASAVLRLEEPYRQTVLLRFYRSLTLGEIATKMGVAATTVEGRLQRGLAKLRFELDREHGGDGRSWVRALLPLAARRSPATGGLALSLSLPFAAKVLVLGGALLLLGLVLRVAFPPDGTASMTPPQPAGGPVPTTDDAIVQRSGLERRPSIPGGALSERRTVGEAAAERVTAPVRGEGSLLVRVHGPDGVPAAGLVVQAWPEETLSAAPRPARTAGDGAALFSRLAAGDWRVELNRGPRARVRVRAGEDAEVTLALPSGPELVGRVVDAVGDPVPGAELWLSAQEPEVYVGQRAVASLVETAPAAVADADGEFRIANAGKALRIGARAPGFAPSSAVAIVRGDLPRVELRLTLAERGGAVSGRVVDPSGSPLAVFRSFSTPREPTRTSSSREPSRTGASVSRACSRVSGACARARRGSRSGACP